MSFDPIGDVAGLGLGRSIAKRRMKRMAAKQKIYCTICVIQGHSKGLSKRWSGCVAQISPSNISSRVRSLLGIPLPFANLIAGQFHVDHIQAIERKVSFREMWAINPDLRFFAVETPTASLVIGVLPGDMGRFVDSIQCMNDGDR